MHRAISLSAPLALAALTFGCAVPPSPSSAQQPSAYVAPASGALARLQVRSLKLAGPAIFYSFDNAQTCSGGRIIADTWTTKGVLKESTALRAGQPATLWLSYLGPGDRACNIVRSFKPDPDKNYLAYALATESGCSLVLQDITDPANPKNERSFVPRTYVPTSAVQAPHCVATDVEAQLAQQRKPNLSGIKMEELAPLLPAHDK
jgi:hypothetical protein